MPEALSRVLLLDERGGPELDEFVTRFQQTSPPVTAKGIEDTAFYRYNRLLALNEVGGDPSRFGVSVADFHAANVERFARFPRNLLVTQTHDTKRSGDVRARIGALSEIPGEWADALGRFRAACAELRRDGGGDAPDPNEESLIFQTLVGAWPISAERLESYLEKALREAKRNTTWVEQDHDYERRVQSYARAVVRYEPFLADFEPFALRVAKLGERSSLAQTLLKLTVPGLPDVYQGDELEALALVDPDNRRPVNWEARRRALAEGGPPKFELIRSALALRARRPECFDERGGYEPLAAEGGEVCAFTRGGGAVAVVVGVRYWIGATVSGLQGHWREVRGDGRELDLGTVAPVDQVVDGEGLALLERI